MSKTTPGKKYVPISLSCDKLKGEMYLIKQKDIDKCRDNAQDWKKYFKGCDASDKIDVKPKEFFKLLELSSTENNVLASLSPEEKIKNLFINKKVNLDSEDAEEESEAAEDTYQKVYSDIINRIHRLNVTHMHELDFKAYEKKKGEEKRIIKEQIDNFGLLPESPKTNIFTEAGIDFSNNQMTFVHPLYFYNHLKTAGMLEFNPYAGKSGTDLDGNKWECIDNPGFAPYYPSYFGDKYDGYGIINVAFNVPLNGKNHAGIDFDGKLDFSTPVKSLIYAKVIGVGTGHTDFGNYVLCQNKNNETKFYLSAHLHSICVEKDEDIVPGKIIGYVGNTGNCWSNCGNRFTKAVRVSDYPEEQAKGWGRHLHLQLIERESLDSFYNPQENYFRIRVNPISNNPFNHSEPWREK